MHDQQTILRHPIEADSRKKDWKTGFTSRKLCFEPKLYMFLIS